MFKKVIEKIRHKLKHAKKEQIANSEATEQRELIKKKINDVIKNDAIDATTYVHQAQEYPANTYTMADASQKLAEAWQKLADSLKKAVEAADAFLTLKKELEIFKEKVEKTMAKDCNNRRKLNHVPMYRTMAYIKAHKNEKR